MFPNDRAIEYLQCVSTSKSIRDRVGGWTEREEDILTYIPLPW